MSADRQFEDAQRQLADRRVEDAVRRLGVTCHVEDALRQLGAAQDIVSRALERPRPAPGAGPAMSDAEVQSLRRIVAELRAAVAEIARPGGGARPPQE